MKMVKNNRKMRDNGMMRKQIKIMKKKIMKNKIKMGIQLTKIFSTEKYSDINEYAEHLYYLDLYGSKLCNNSFTWCFQKNERILLFTMQT